MPWERVERRNQQPLPAGCCRLIVVDLLTLITSPLFSDHGQFNKRLALGDRADRSGNVAWFVVTALPAAEAHTYLHPYLNVFFQQRRWAQSGFSCRVKYVSIEGRTITERDYQYAGIQAPTAIVYVTCASDDTGLPARHDWAHLLRTAVGAKSVEPGFGEIEDLIPALPAGSGFEHLVVLRYSREKPGYLVALFRWREVTGTG